MRMESAAKVCLKCGGVGGRRRGHAASSSQIVKDESSIPGDWREILYSVVA